MSFNAKIQLIYQGITKYKHTVKYYPREMGVPPLLLVGTGDVDKSWKMFGGRFSPGSEQLDQVINNLMQHVCNKCFSIYN